jgi:hypothetical protein
VWRLSGSTSTERTSLTSYNAQGDVSVKIDKSVYELIRTQQCPGELLIAWAGCGLGDDRGAADGVQVKEVARRYGVSESSVKRLIKNTSPVV